MNPPHNFVLQGVNHKHNFVRKGMNLLHNLVMWGMKSSSRDGQLLVESLIATSLLIVGFLGIFSLLSRSISLNRVAADSYTATYLAAESIEVARNIVDANALQKKPWNSGFANGDYELEYNAVSLTPDQDRFLQFDSGNNTYSYSGTNQTNFKRVIKIVLVSANEIQVNAIVSWTTLGGGSYQVNLEDHFFNWRS